MVGFLSQELPPSPLPCESRGSKLKPNGPCRKVPLNECILLNINSNFRLCVGIGLFVAANEESGWIGICQQLLTARLCVYSRSLTYLEFGLYLLLFHLPWNGRPLVMQSKTGPCDISWWLCLLVGCFCLYSFILQCRFRSALTFSQFFFCKMMIYQHFYSQ